MKLDLIEAITNAVIGIAVSILLTYLALPLWGLKPSLQGSVGITAMFFLASLARSYLLRRFFRRIGNV